MPLWKIHGDGRTVAPGQVVKPEERLSWPATIAIGAQHVVAMFGATFLVPILTHFPVPTTLLFSGVGTILFLLVTRNKLPSYLGSSFAFIAPVTAATAANATGASDGIGSALAGSQSWGVPAGFDTEGFLSAAKRNFVTLQAAWDRSDIATLRSMMTDGMLGEIRSQLSEREAHRGSEPNQTDVVMIDAQLLGIEDLGGDYMASVEFSGMIREEPSAGPSPFREVWNMAKPKDGSAGWLVAGVQALQ